MIFQEIKEATKIFKIISKKRKTQFIALIFLIITSTILEILTISFLVPFLSIISGENIKNNAINNLLKLVQFSSEENIFFQLSSILILIIGLSMISRILIIFIQFKLSSRISSEIGLKILSKSISMPYQWHIDTNSSFVKGYLTKDIDNLNEYMRGFIMIAVNSILILGISSYLIFNYPREMIFLLSIVGCMYLFIYLFIKAGLSNDGISYSIKYQESLQFIEEILNNI